MLETSILLELEHGKDITLTPKETRRLTLTTDKVRWPYVSASANLAWFLRSPRGLEGFEISEPCDFVPGDNFTLQNLPCSALMSFMDGSREEGKQPLYMHYTRTNLAPQRVVEMFCRYLSAIRAQEIEISTGGLTAVVHQWPKPPEGKIYTLY